MSRPLSILLFLTICCYLPVMAQLKADFTPDKAGGCSPLIVSYTNRTTGASASATWQWDLGNGNTATVRDAQAVYTDETSYTVTLTVHDGGAVASVTHTVTVYSPPALPSFSFSPVKVCGPMPITFTGNAQPGGGAGGGSGSGAGGGITSWLWDFGDGTTQQSAGAVVQHVYTASLNTTASLTVTNSYGCTSTASAPVQVQVLAPLTSAFTSDKRILCLVTDPVQFTNNSAGPGTLSYSWDFGDGTVSAQPNPSHSYAQKNNYTVKLTTTSSEGCSATATQTDYLNVANYSTDFDVSASFVCQGDNITFNDRSRPAPNSQVWTVDGNTVGFYSPASATFNIQGTHTVQLNNVFGSCPQSASKPVIVNTKPVAVPFDQHVTQDCNGITVAFTDKTPGAVGWSWDLGLFSGLVVSETPTITQHYAFNESYGVYLSVTGANGCSAVVGEQVYLGKTIPSIYEPNPAPVTSCVQPLTKTYAIYNQDQLQSWYWDFGDGAAASTDVSPTHTFSNPGQYNTVLHYTDKSGCSGQSNALPTIIGAAMPLDFSANPTTVCVGTGVSFASPSLIAANPVSVGWQFGDGGNSVSTAPSHSYSSPGVYTVVLTARNAGGCEATMRKTDYITVLAPPGIFSGHTNTCDGDRGVVTFTFIPGSATSLSWDFGDGSAPQKTDGSTSQLQHTYLKTGTYYPQLTSSNGQCSAQQSDVVRVLLKQQLKLTSSSAMVCADGTLNVQLAAERNPYQINSGYEDDYTPQFRYGDGTPFTGSVYPTDPYNTYSNNTFNWTLSGFEQGKSGLQVVTTSFGMGCTDVSNILPLTIRGSATAAFTVISDDQCYQSPVVLKDASTVTPDNSIVSETWDFGDGQTASQIGGTVTHTYTTPGDYAVRLMVHDAAGCVHSSGANQAYVSVNGPQAFFTPSGTDVHLNTSVYFQNSSNTVGSDNVVWSWDFGDGSVASDYSPFHTYTTPGTYKVTLTAKDAVSAKTCVSVANATIVVRNFNSHFSVGASYITNGSCPPVLAQFVNTSSNYSGVRWDFGDGWTAGNVNTPSHVYQQPGRYIVTLYVDGYNGLTAKYIDSVIVREPVAVLSAAAASLCAGGAAQLEATATGAVRYSWDFGDGSVLPGNFPDSVVSHTYPAGGNYVARLVVTDTFGCQRTATTPVNLLVNPLPVVMVSPPLPFVCKNASVTLTASGGTGYAWSPAEGLDRTDVAGPVASPVASTVYTVVVKNDAGCESSKSVAVAVVFPQTLTVTPDSTAVCLGDAVQLQAKGTDYYSWSAGGGEVSYISVGTVLVKPLVSGIYTALGGDIHGCFSDTATVIVTVLPVPSVNAGPDVEVLAGSPVVLQATGSADVLSWDWSPKDYLSCSDCGQPVSSPRKPELYIVTVKNSEGCSAKDTVAAKILCEESLVRIPDAFSPNGDGKNDRWVIRGIGAVKHLVVYSRWGAKIWERNNFYPADAGSDWDGMFNGQPAPVGAYAYYVEMDCPTGGVFGRMGTVVLVR